MTLRLQSARVATVRPHALGGVVVEIPLAAALPSAANARGHTLARAGSIARHRALVVQVLRALVRTPPAGDLVVCCTRIAPRALDDDNAAGAVKASRDAVAEWLGVDDRNPRVTWRVDQARGAPALRVEIVPVRAWTTTAPSSRVTQDGAVTVVDVTLPRGATAGEWTIGAVRLRLHAVE